MATKVISYSYTGNNEALASKYAQTNGADHIRVEEKKERTMMKIVTDTIINPRPKLKTEPGGIMESDRVIVFSPIWMGKIAAPVRAWLEKIGESGAEYGFFSISGGADGPDSNDRILGELEARVGRLPGVFADLHIVDLLPQEPAPTRDMTMKYHLSDEEVESLVEQLPSMKNG